jgi:membrane-associated phospholipid phosphatase
LETIAFLQRFAAPALDSIMLMITNLGDEQAYIAMLVIIYLAISPTWGRRVGIALMLSFFLNFHLKGIVDTPRPFDVDPDVARGEAAVATAPGAGFPSGHAQGAATFWGYLAVQVRRPMFWVLAVVVVALVSLSRIYLGLHVPADVLGGLAIAAVLVAVAYGVQRVLPAWLARSGRLAALERSARAWPRLPLLVAAGVLVPLALHLTLPVDNSALLMGGLAAFLTAPLLIRHHLPAELARRVAAAAVGLVLVFAVLLGSSVLLPEAVKLDPLGGFARFLLLGYVGLALTPYLLRLARLAPAVPAPTGAVPAPAGAVPAPAGAETVTGRTAGS